MDSRSSNQQQTAIKKFCKDHICPSKKIIKTELDHNLLICHNFVVLSRQTISATLSENDSQQNNVLTHQQRGEGDKRGIQSQKQQNCSTELSHSSHSGNQSLLREYNTNVTDTQMNKNQSTQTTKQLRPKGSNLQFDKKTESPQRKKSIEFSFNLQSPIDKKNNCFIQLKRLGVIRHILGTIDRNKAYMSGFAHVLVLSGVALLTVITFNQDFQSYLTTILFIIVKKLTKPQTSKQLKRETLVECMRIFINYKNVSYEEVMNYLRSFLENEGEMAKVICPYYYNFFAFLVNKDIIFGGNPRITLIQYSIEFKHKQYDDSFQSSDVLNQVNALEQVLVRNYHSNDI